MQKAESGDYEVNKNVPFILLSIFLANPIHYANASCNQYPSCVFLVKEEENTEQKQKWQENSLPLNIPPDNPLEVNNFSVVFGWKLNKKFIKSNEWRLEVNAKY